MCKEHFSIQSGASFFDQVITEKQKKEIFTICTLWDVAIRKYFYYLFSNTPSASYPSPNVLVFQKQANK